MNWLKIIGAGEMGSFLLIVMLMFAIDTHMIK